jgi:hypothetical protein
MRRLLAVAAGILSVLLAVSCAEPSSSSQEVAGQVENDSSHAGKTIDTARTPVAEEPEAPIYEVQVEMENVCSAGRVLVNGFPVDKWGGRGTRQKYDFSVNTALVGEGNVLRVNNEPCLTPSGRGVSVGPVKMEAWVKGPNDEPRGRITRARVDSAYQAWMERAQKKLEELGSQDGDLDSMRAWAARHPMTVSVTFDNEAGPDYSRIFEEAPVIEDSSRLKDYAMHLRDLLLAEQPKQIYAELRPSVAEETGAYQVAHEPGREAAVAYIRTEWIPNWETDFARSDVRVRRWCGGRVWELRKRGPGGSLEPLLHSEHSHLKVYVAEIGGELRIVRLTA